MIRPATKQDADAIASIYNHYIKNSTISFEETPVSDIGNLRYGNLQCHEGINAASQTPRLKPLSSPI